MYLTQQMTTTIYTHFIIVLKLLMYAVCKAMYFILNIFVTSFVQIYVIVWYFVHSLESEALPPPKIW